MYDNKSMELIKAVEPITKKIMNKKLENKDDMKNQKKRVRFYYEKSFTDYLEEIKNAEKSSSVELNLFNHFNYIKPHLEFNTELNEVQENINRMLAEKMYNN